MASYYSGAGDGYCDNYTGTGWDAIHDRVSSSESNYGGSNAYWMFDPDEIFRTFLPINTNGIEGTVTQAIFKTYCSDIWGGLNDGNYWLNVVQTTQASSSTISTDDYDQCGSINNPTEGASRIDMYGHSSASYINFTLNSTGISWINKSGITKLGLREGHDALDNPIETGGGINSIYFSEDTSGTKDPYLDVTVLQIYVIFQFKDYSPIGQEQGFNINWNGQSSVAPSDSPVILQIYNFDTTLWEDVVTNNTAAANTDFTLTAWIGDSGEDVSAYHDANDMICCRVYQGG